MIGPRTTIADRPHRISLQNPSGDPISDGSGGYTQAYADLTPRAVDAKIARASAADLERLVSGTVLTTADYIVTMPYHPQVTSETRILYNGRLFYVQGPPVNRDERNVETIAVCREIIG